MVPFYVRVPAGVVLASRPFAFCVNPHVLPRVPNLRITWEKDRWLPSEDALLAAGIENYGVRWDVIRFNLLPAKTRGRSSTGRRTATRRGSRARTSCATRSRRFCSRSAAEIPEFARFCATTCRPAASWDDPASAFNASYLDRLGKKRTRVVSWRASRTRNRARLCCWRAPSTSERRRSTRSAPAWRPQRVHPSRKAKLGAARKPTRPAGFGCSGRPRFEVPRLDHGGFGGFDGSGARRRTRRPRKRSRRASPRRRGAAPPASLLFGRLKDSRTVLGFGMASGARRRRRRRRHGARWRAPLFALEGARGARSPPKAAATRTRRDPAHTPGKGVDFEREALPPRTGDDDDARGAWARRGRGRPSRAACTQRPAGHAARRGGREALPSSDDGSGTRSAPSASIVSSEDERAERSDLEDSDDEDAGNGTGHRLGTRQERHRRRRAPPRPRRLRFCSGRWRARCRFRGGRVRPFPNRASGAAERRSARVVRRRDHAVLVAAQTRGVSAARGKPGGGPAACRSRSRTGGGAVRVLCDAAKNRSARARRAREAKGQATQASARMAGQ